jgi:hypothetical protein
MALRDIFLHFAKGHNEQPLVTTVHDEIVPCECGCGNYYPKSQMVATPTNYEGHPEEFVYTLHHHALNSER